MKKIILYCFLFLMYVGPIWYGLIYRDALWIEYGSIWLIAGVFPILAFGSGIEENI